MTIKKNQHIAIGITAGIAGYKIVDLIKSLKSQNITVSVIMTDNAVKMFGKAMFEKASGRSVYSQMIPPDFDYRQVLEIKKVEHISLADTLDLLVIAPASADLLAKIAHGLADDYLSTLVLSVTCPCLIAPSMNTNMWHKKVTQENLVKVQQLGYLTVIPDSGQLACGYDGIGRLKNIKDLEISILEILNKKNKLSGKKILITAGATQSPIDSVRLLTNRASGKFGKALAEECYLQGADVLLLRSESSARPDINIPELIFRSVADLEILLAKYCPLYDIIFHSSAVSDFYPDKVEKGKLISSKSFKVTFKPEKKLINLIKKWNSKITLIGFKASFRPAPSEFAGIGRKLISQSKADYVIINDIGRNDIGFGSDYNEVYLLRAKDNMLIKINRQKKEMIARNLIDNILENKN